MKKLLVVGFAVGWSGLFSIPNALAQTTTAPQPTICSRACWGARAPQCSISQMGALTRAVIHHTASASDFDTTSQSTSASRVRGTQNIHMDSNGWCDIGYHFLVCKLGNIFEGRSSSISSRPRGSHDGVNTDSFGFTWLGYFHAPYNQNPPSAQRNALYDVMAWKMPSGWTPYGTSSYDGSTVGKLCGHRNALATACPGDIAYNNYVTGNTSGGEARTSVGNRRTPSTSYIVDNAHTGFSASANWSTGSAQADKYSADYRYRNTAAVSDAAQWVANLPTTKSYTVSAWWSVGSNRSTTAPYQIVHASGTTTVNVNQQLNGGQWNVLGSWTMNAGNNTVKLSCWTTTGYVVLADAVKWQ